MTTNQQGGRGKWHGKRCYFGFHHDLHVDQRDREIGTHCDPTELAPMLKLTGADFVQTDSKGHTGCTSWFSQNPHATVGVGVVRDALRGWRDATLKLGLPLHCHYSGIWDQAAGAKHPEWCIRNADGKAVSSPWLGVASATGDKMCPRSAYRTELMVPQLLEMIDRYGVDGFWIDGDLWAMEPCYCERCRAAFREQTGLAEPPRQPGDSHWAEWWNFTRESFEDYVTRYCDAIHQQRPGALICSNWLQTFRHPGEPTVPTDWISGDNTAVWGLDSCRCEARFISTRGKPWDIMMWCFYFSRGWLGEPDWAPAMKPVQMLQQEAAVIVALGGNVQTCENPFSGVRTGQLIPWRLKRIRELARFVKQRRAWCQDTETIPQVAVLHSEHHVRATPHGANLMWGIDVAPVQGAVYSLLECHYGVDVLDEWALRPRLAEFPVVVVPEQDCLSDAMVAALREYTHAGGKLVVSGARAVERFGGEFLGVTPGKLVAKAAYHVPAQDGMVPIVSDPWRLAELTTARSLGPLGTTPLPDEYLLPHPAATLNRVGKGAVAYVPGNVFRDFERSRYPLVRSFINDVVRAAAGRLDPVVTAPVCVDVVLRRRGPTMIVHLINRSSGIPNLPNSGVIDDIPQVGPIAVSMKCPGRPRKVTLVFERAPLTWRYVPGRRGGKLTVEVPAIRLHAAVVIEGR